jgi:phthalate 4,5-cis-dihydrodiol dehydrogenase
MKPEKIKVGLVGLGEQSVDNLLPSLFLSSYANLIAICDINENKLNSIGRKNGIAHSYIDYRSMIDNEGLDAVVVCSFPDVHYEVAKYALENGLHVFVEKPPVNNITQLKELIALASSKSLRAGVGMNFSYTDSNKIIHEIMQSDDFDEPAFISVEHVSSKPTTVLWNLDSVMDSFLLAQLIHPLDYLLSFGGRYNSIHVYSSRSHSPLFIQVMIEFENNIIGCLKSGTFYPRFKHTIEIISRAGTTITVKDLGTIEVTRKDMPVPFDLKSKYCSTVYTPSPLKSGYSKAGYIGELEAFFQNILYNRDYRHSFSDLLPVYEALDKISSALGRHRQNESKLTVYEA